MMFLELLSVLAVAVVGAAIVAMVAGGAAVVFFSLYKLIVASVSMKQKRAIPVRVPRR
ncbi:MAG: hypothetical protein LIP02_01810 [Bacteroidales bacterium]|nr:hypothetical protein [Bacteroidales bacterium]